MDLKLNALASGQKPEPLYITVKRKAMRLEFVVKRSRGQLVESNTQTSTEHNIAQTKQEPTVAHALEPHQDVVWQFRNVPEGWIPFILIFDGSGDRFGPFDAFEQQESQVTARNNDCRVGNFRYYAMLRDTRLPRMNMLVSPPAELIQGASAVIDVFIDLQNEQFRIKPHSVSIEPGEKVHWRFPDLDPQFIPEICFYECTRKDLMGSQTQGVGYFGPFKTISHVADGISGEGDNGEARGVFSYFVDVTSLDLSKRHRRLNSVNSKDPFVDTEKDPSSPHSGTGGSGGGGQYEKKRKT